MKFWSFYSIVITAIAIYLWLDGGMNNDTLTSLGFGLSLVGLVVSFVGTILSGKSFVNARAAKEAANEAKEQFKRGKQNIELSQLHKLGNEVLNITQKLNDEDSENVQEILLKITQFAFECSRVSPSITINNYGLSKKPELINYNVIEYRTALEERDRKRIQSKVLEISNHINGILIIIQEQIDGNTSQQ
ncbi:hypothetical protein ACI2WT_18240 [Lysinibacillus fusiformis]